MFAYTNGLAVDVNGVPQPGVNFTLYNNAGGTAQAMYNMNGTPITYVTTGNDGIFPPFQADISFGVLFNGGTVFLPVYCTADLDPTQANLAAQNAAASASDAAFAAQQSSVNAGTAANSAAASLALAQAAPGLPAIFQNGDGTWPSRLNRTSDRTKLVAFIYTDDTRLPATAPVTGSTGGQLDLPTPLDFFIASNPS